VNQLLWHLVADSESTLEAAGHHSTEAILQIA
jgi:hypothetical protein